MEKNNFDYLMKQAVDRMIVQELSRVPSNEYLKERYHLSEGFYKQMEDLINQYEKKAVQKVRWLKAGVIAVCILLIVMWWKPELLVKAKNLIWEWFDSYVSFHLEVDSAKLDDEGGYYFTSLPDGYIIVEQDMVDNMGFITCADQNENYLELIYTVGSNDANFNNDEKGIQEIYEDGIIFYYLESLTGENNILVWKDEEEDVSFSLFSILDYDQMQEIRKGIQKVKND